MSDTAVAKPMHASSPKKKSKSSADPKSSSSSSSSGDRSKKHADKKRSGKKGEEDDMVVVVEEHRPEDKPASTKALKRKMEESPNKKGKKKKDKGKEKEHATSSSRTDKSDVSGEETSSRKRQRLQLETLALGLPETLPSLACFPNAPPPLSSLHNEEDGGLKFGVWERKGILRTKKMLVAETDKMLYLGQPVLRDPCKYYVMAVDRKTQKATIIPVDKMYHMQQQIKGYTPQLPTEDDEEVTRASQKEKLVRRFGSKKQKTLANVAEANRIVTGAVSHADQLMSEFEEKALQHAAEAVEIDMHPELPPHNANASVPEDIYPLENIVPSDILNQLDPSTLIKCVKDGDEVTATRKYGSYIAERAKSLGGLMPGEQERRGRLLVLVAGFLRLLRFLNSQKTTFKPNAAKEASEGVFSNDVNHYCLSLFADLQGIQYRASKIANARLVNYIIIALLHASDFKIDAAPLSVALGMNLTKCQQYLVHVGCKPVRRLKKKPSEEEEAEEKMAEGRKEFALQAPLALPDKTKKRGRR